MLSGGVINVLQFLYISEQAIVLGNTHLGALFSDIQSLNIEEQDSTFELVINPIIDLKLEHFSNMPSREYDALVSLTSSYNSISDGPSIIELQSTLHLSILSIAGWTIMGDLYQK